jgi:hypothetical protein
MKKLIDILIQDETPTERLQTELKAYLLAHNLNAVSIKEGRQKNPFPIGNRAVYELYRGGNITDSHKWKMYVFFNQLKA